MARTPCFALISSAVSKIDGHGSDQSMISAAVRQGALRPALPSGSSGLPCVGAGQTLHHSSRLLNLGAFFRAQLDTLAGFE